MTKKKYKGAEIPYSEEAEESLIGTILSNREDALKQAVQMLAPEDFYTVEAATVFEVCISLKDNRQEANKESIIRELKACGEFGETVGEEYLSNVVQAADAVFFSSNLSKIKNLSILRKIIQMGGKMQKDALVPDAESTTIIQDIDAEFNALKGRTKGMGPRIVSLEILTSNPRKYSMKFSNGADVDISIEDIMNPRAIEKAIINTLDFVPALPKDWRSFADKLMVNAKKLPSDADVNMEILDTMRDLFEAKGEGREASDFRSGAYAKEEIDNEQFYLFQKSPIITYVKQQLDRKISTADLWQLVHGWGGINEKDGKPLSKWVGSSSRTGLWGLPSKVIEEGIFKKGDKIEISKDGKVDVSWLRG